jgi:intracellular multiplication protein IcmD
MASSMTGSFNSVAKLITAGSYLAGLGFSIGAIMKFKQHKDNPTQVPIGTPIALVFIAAALLFLPTILGVTGQTMFGTSGKTAGPSGSVYQ